jgi:hypothetical protein
MFRIRDRAYAPLARSLGGAVLILLSIFTVSDLDGAALAAPETQQAEATPTPRRNVGTFQYTFRRANDAWPETPPEANPVAAFTAEDGYHIKVSEQASRVHWMIRAVRPPLPRRDVFAEADVKLLEGRPSASYGFSIRATREPISSYLLVINGQQQFALFRERDRGLDDIPLVPWQRSELLRPGGEGNVIGLVAQDSALVVLLNGKRAARIEDPNAGQVPGGEILLRAYAGAHVVYRQFLVTNPADGETAPTPDAAPPALPGPLRPGFTCEPVTGATCLRVQSDLAEAVRALNASEIGRELVTWLTANAIEVEWAPPQLTALGTFDAGRIALHPALLGGMGTERAAYLAYYTHVMREFIAGEERCETLEENALQAQANAWRGMWVGGLPDPSNVFQLALDLITFSAEEGISPLASVLPEGFPRLCA